MKKCLLNSLCPIIIHSSLTIKAELKSVLCYGHQNGFSENAEGLISRNVQHMCLFSGQRALTQVSRLFSASYANQTHTHTRTHTHIYIYIYIYMYIYIYLLSDSYHTISRVGYVELISPISRCKLFSVEMLLQFFRTCSLMGMCL